MHAFYALNTQSETTGDADDGDMVLNNDQGHTKGVGGEENEDEEKRDSQQHEDEENITGEDEEKYEDKEEEDTNKHRDEDDENELKHQGDQEESDESEREGGTEEHNEEHSSLENENNSESEEEESQQDDDETHESAVGKAPSSQSTEPSPLPIRGKLKNLGNVTKAIPLGTFNNTRVYIPVVVPQRVIKPGNNKTQDVKKNEEKLSEMEGSTVSSVVKASSMLEIKNTKIKPLKYDENFTILVAKKNKVIESSKTNGTKSKRHLKRERRRAPYSYEDDSGSHQYSQESEESEERDSGSTSIRGADHDYDGDYEYVRPDELRSPENSRPSDESETTGPSGPADSSESTDYAEPSGPSAPDAYDIHGYRGEQKTTHWPPNSQVQPAYALTEGKPPTPHMESGKPQTFKQPMRDYGSGHHRHPGGATSSTTFNMGSNEHHHHHFYDKLKETHENKPKDYHHSTKFLIPPDIYRKYPGKHKHFHHVKTPKGQQVIEESEEDDPNFDPNTLTDKDHEEAFKTYDEEEIAVDVNYDDSDRPKSFKPLGTTRKPTPRVHISPKKEVFTSKHLVQYRSPGSAGKSSGSQNKAEVERIFDAVERAMRKENVAMKSSQSMNILPTGSALMWPLGYPRGLDLRRNR
ncbi:hypothetical protein GE061_010794 [Apolygus lucorum]|uniref:Uncharacterized protein n=1 Tax=Apolygus lucorum TaxID=248454 RepID=A0A6A4IPU6_APOLU|nr:hypothetical protein GE061_010794 [Apolygus lucorum]